jgi:serine/threonine protein phosphatase PrpC
MGGHTTAVRAVSTFTSQGERPGQEDHILCVREKGIFVIADGFGGPAAGALASRTACESVRGFLFKEAGDLEATLPFVLRSYFSLAGNVLFNALIHANRKVRRENRDKGVHERGGASVLAGFLDGDLLALANVGGCSATLVRGGRSVELVMPRTYGRLVDPFDRQPGGDRAERDVPLMAVGLAEDLEPEIFECRVRPGDWLLLNTDGVSSEVMGWLSEIQRTETSPEAATEAANTLLEQIRFRDNASVLLIIF